MSEEAAKKTEEGGNTPAPEGGTPAPTPDVEKMVAEAVKVATADAVAALETAQNQTKEVVQEVNRLKEGENALRDRLLSALNPEDAKDQSKISEAARELLLNTTETLGTAARVASDDAVQRMEAIRQEERLIDRAAKKVARDRPDILGNDQARAQVQRNFQDALRNDDSEQKDYDKLMESAVREYDLLMESAGLGSVEDRVAAAGTVPVGGTASASGEASKGNAQDMADVKAAEAKYQQERYKRSRQLRNLSIPD